jgi:hypothetical protein
MNDLTDENLIDIYHIIFTDIHSRGFMTAEIKNLLFEPDYWFLQPPKKKDWHDDVIEYLKGINYDTSNLNINSRII